MKSVLSLCFFLILHTCVLSQNFMTVHVTGGQIYTYDISTIDSISFVSNPPPEYMLVFQNGTVLDQFLSSDIDSITFFVYGSLPSNIFNSGIVYDSIVDVDLNTYRTVAIGSQVWMAENLRVTKFSNGDTLFHSEDLSVWSTVQRGAWINYQNDSSSVNPRGKLYNWYTIEDPRNVCPTGWRVPSDKDWETLIDYLGGEWAASDELKSTNISYWQGNLTANNNSGFSAITTGKKYDTFFSALGNIAEFWTSSYFPFPSIHSSNCLHIRLEVNNSYIYESADNPSIGNYIRCIQGDAEFPIGPIIDENYGHVLNPDSIYNSVADIDGNVYRTTYIGEQEWMAENLRTTRFMNGDSIPFVFQDIDWQSQNSPAYCTKETIVDTVGYTCGNLYNWYTIIDDRNLCPSGWHVPTVTDWDKAIVAMDGARVSGQKLKSHWWEGQESFTSSLTNQSGFSGVSWPTRDTDGSYSSDVSAKWWSLGGFAENNTLPSYIDIDNLDSLVFHLPLWGSFQNKGKSVRCVRDGITEFSNSNLFNPRYSNRYRR